MRSAGRNARGLREGPVRKSQMPVYGSTEVERSGILELPDNPLPTDSGPSSSQNPNVLLATVLRMHVLPQVGTDS